MAAFDDRDLLQCIYHTDDAEAVAKLIQGGADYKANHHQPLRLAAEECRPESFAVLLELGYRPAFERGESHLDPMPEQVLIYVLKYLPESAHELLKVLEFTPSAKVMQAAIGPRTQSLRLLLQKGGDPNGSFPFPLLSLAASVNEIGDVEVLLEHGADPYAEDRRAIKTATRHGHMEIAKLIERFAIQSRLNSAVQAMSAVGCSQWF